MENKIHEFGVCETETEICQELIPRPDAFSAFYCGATGSVGRRCGDFHCCPFDKRKMIPKKIK